MSSINQNMCLYIPYVEDHITEFQIANTFKTLFIGEVKYVDFIETYNEGEKYMEAYVYFNFWYENTTVENLQNKLLTNKKETRIIYDEPEFWVIYENDSISMTEDNCIENGEENCIENVEEYMNCNTEEQNEDNYLFATDYLNYNLGNVYDEGFNYMYQEFYYQQCAQIY